MSKDTSEMSQQEIKDKATHLLNVHGKGLEILAERISLNPQFRAQTQFIPAILEALKSISEGQQYLKEYTGQGGIGTLHKDPQESLYILINNTELIESLSTEKDELNKILKELSSLAKAPTPKGPYDDLSSQIDELLKAYAEESSAIRNRDVRNELVKYGEYLIVLKKEIYKAPNSQSMAHFKQLVEEKTQDTLNQLKKIPMPETSKVVAVNLLKDMANAITSAIAKVGTLGHSKHQGFFEKKQRMADTTKQSKLVEDLGKDINNSIKP